MVPWEAKFFKYSICAWFSKIFYILIDLFLIALLRYSLHTIKFTHLKLYNVMIFSKCTKLCKCHEVRFRTFHLKKIPPAHVQWPLFPSLLINLCILNLPGSERCKCGVVLSTLRGVRVGVGKQSAWKLAWLSALWIFSWPVCRSLSNS